jgi:hypothetical protein
MSPIRREVINGLFVIILSTLLSAAIAAFQVKFNLPVWTFIVMGVAIAVSGYVMFEIGRGFMASTEDREKEWLKRVGNPARLELGLVEGGAAVDLLNQTTKAMRPGSDLTVLTYVGPEGDAAMGGRMGDEARVQFYRSIVDLLKRGAVREFKRLLCFDHDVLANDPELKSGILRVGEGPGTITRLMGEHCRLMMETKGCSLYVAPAVLRNTVGLYGTDKVAMTVETRDPDTGVRTVPGILLFADPPNGEIIEQFRQLERATERRMVAVHKIVFPEDAVATAERATR